MAVHCDLLIMTFQALRLKKASLLKKILKLGPLVFASEVDANLAQAQVKS